MCCDRVVSVVEIDDTAQSVQLRLKFATSRPSQPYGNQVLLKTSRRKQSDYRPIFTEQRAK